MKRLPFYLIATIILVSLSGFNNPNEAITSEKNQPNPSILCYENEWFSFEYSNDLNVTEEFNHNLDSLFPESDVRGISVDLTNKKTGEHIFKIVKSATPMELVHIISPEEWRDLSIESNQSNNCVLYSIEDSLLFRGFPAANAIFLTDEDESLYMWDQNVVVSDKSLFYINIKAPVDSVETYFKKYLDHIFDTFTFSD